MIDKKRIENAIREILIAIGENPDREGLIETPKRVANMYEEIFAGLHKNPMDDVKVFNEGYTNNIIVEKDIPLYSMCEHHLLPFYGVAHVAYIPSNGNILGLSKIARIVDTASKKPQLQEKLSNDIANVMEKACNPKGVLVIIRAEHTCMTMRGIKKPGSKTVTITSRGVFDNDINLRQEAFKLINIS